MAITRQDGGGIRYYGLSGDTKPTDAPAGSKYHESDTGDVYTYSGSAWFQAGSDASGGTTELLVDGDPVSDANPLSVQQAELTRAVDEATVVLQSNAIMDGTTALTPKFAPIAVAASGDNTLVAAVALKKIRVHALAVIAGAAVSCYFQSAAAGDVIFGGSTNTMDLAANGGFVLPYSEVGWFETDAGELLNLNLSGAVKVAGGLQYTEV
jgi:hypothetical protein